MEQNRVYLQQYLHNINNSKQLNANDIQINAHQIDVDYFDITAHKMEINAYGSSTV